MYTYKVINRPAGRSYLKNREFLRQEDEGRGRGLPQSTSSETHRATHVHWVSKNVEREPTPHHSAFLSLFLKKGETWKIHTPQLVNPSRSQNNHQGMSQ